jgi:hypothetical protein
MKRPFCIWIVTPPDYLFTRAFESQAEALQASFAELGINAPIVTDPSQVRGTAIVFAANMLGYIGAAPPSDLIVFNMEQIDRDSHDWPGYIDLLRRHRVWDYSDRNIANLKSDYGIDVVAKCGLGYMPILTTVSQGPEDVDVIFIGSTNERRVAVLHELMAHGKTVWHGRHVYGKERDEFVARGKLQINLHYHTAHVFEISRVSYLLANSRCVVSETGLDEALEAPLRGGVAFCAYDELVPTCLRLLDDVEERARIARRGFELFSAMSQTPMLLDALRATFPGEF